jgi:glycosyltransferase involved in cell wall biosynthesis
MRILVLAGGFYPKVGGGALAQWQFARITASRGNEVTVFTPREESDVERERLEEVEIRRPLKRTPSLINGASPAGIIYRVFFSIVFTFFVAKWMLSNNVEIIYSSSHSTHFTAKVLSTIFSKPSIHFVGYTPSVSGENRAITNPLYLFEQLNFKFFLGDVTFCRTPPVKRIIEERSNAHVELIDGILNDEDLKEATDGLPINQLRDSVNVGEDERLLIYVGRLVEIKRPERLIQILSKLPDTFRLLIVGDGPMWDAVHQHANQSGIADRVVMMGKLQHVDALKYISISDDLILTSETEAFPTVVFEGLALGTNVFAPPTGILPHLSHPRLHIHHIDDFPGAIQEVDAPKLGQIDSDVLNRYSIQNYANTVLDMCHALSRE